VTIKSAAFLFGLLIAISDQPAAGGAQFAGRKKYVDSHKEHDSVLLGELDKQDGKLNHSPAECYAFPVKAGQHVSLRYAKTGDSDLPNLRLIIYGPDGLYSKQEGDDLIECELEINRNGNLFLAATTNYMGDRYGAYSLHVRGLDRPLADITQPMSTKDFLDVMKSNRHPLMKEPQNTWGDEKANSAAIEFDFSSFNPGYLEQIIFKKVNQIRQKNGLPVMEYSDILNRSARQHSEEMAELNYFSHESPVEEYATPDIRIRNVFGFKGRRTAENIATQTFEGKCLLGNPSYEKLAEDAMEMWMNSSGHRRQILSKNLSFLGVGCALVIDGDKKSFYYTQNFGGM
jgi:uncharacterized protein YkwD